MADRSRIEWTNAAWNPVIGCTQTASGCRHCHAQRQPARLVRMGGTEYGGLTKNGRWSGDSRARRHDAAMATVPVVDDVRWLNGASALRRHSWRR
jgi:protein gp37